MRNIFIACDTSSIKTVKKINDEYFLEFVDLSPTSAIMRFLQDSNSLLNIDFPPRDICNRWVTEWHCDLPTWFGKLSKVLINGSLLVVDYAMESKRYYNAMRQDGTLISYRNHVANPNVLKDAGLCDLTAHLCIESTINYALFNGWKFMGETRQGQALLALGLSRFLYSIQNNQVTLAKAGTGVGKSAIAVTVSKMLSESPEIEGYQNGGLFVTTQKLLQDQYEKDFLSFKILSASAISRELRVLFFP